MPALVCGLAVHLRFHTLIRLLQVTCHFKMDQVPKFINIWSSEDVSDFFSKLGLSDAYEENKGNSFPFKQVYNAQSA